MTGRRREYQKRETRRLLLDTAYDLFLEKGYEKTTIKKLAERAGVAQGTIFKHFPDKTALIVAAIETGHAGGGGRMFCFAPRHRPEKPAHLYHPTVLRLL